MAGNAGRNFPAMMGDGARLGRWVRTPECRASLPPVRGAAVPPRHAGNLLRVAARGAAGAWFARPVGWREQAQGPFHQGVVSLNPRNFRLSSADRSKNSKRFVSTKRGSPVLASGSGTVTTIRISRSRLSRTGSLPWCVGEGRRANMGNSHSASASVRRPLSWAC
jgi:hypothetical protein